MEKLFGKEYLVNIFEKIGKGLNRQVVAFVLGGGAMCFRNQKSGTKDLDIVFLEINSAKEFSNSAIKMGFSSLGQVEKEYQAMNAYAILENADGFRLDIFSKTVCNALGITISMAERAEIFGKHGRLEIRLVSNEDVILFKGITERARDVDDIAAVIRSSSINWNIIFRRV